MLRIVNLPVLSQECYNQPNCTGDSVAVLVSIAKECCVGTNDGMSFADENGTCIVSQCIGNLLKLFFDTDSSTLT